MPPFPEKESNGILNLLKKKRPGRVPNNPGMRLYVRFSLLPRVGHQRIYLLYKKIEFWNTQWTWFGGLKTGLAICLSVYKQSNLANVESISTVSTWEAKRAVWGEVGGSWGSILFNADLFKYISLVCMFVCPFILKYWVQFHVSVYLQFRIRLLTNNPRNWVHSPRNWVHIK